MIRMVLFILVALLLTACTKNDEALITQKLSGKTWSEKLGFPQDKRVLILHADDVGMCYEANEAAKPYLSMDKIQSASMMVPCPWFNAFAEWYKDNPHEDIGLHLTLTSEWKTYRWGPVANAQDVPGLIDPEGYMWRDVLNVVQHATPHEVEVEVRAQIEKALSKEINPSHIDTHMGTLYGSLEFAKVYLTLAMEYEIPAMVIEFTEPIVERFRGEGYPITNEMIEFAMDYQLPKLDDFHSVSGATTYQHKKQKFFDLVHSLTPGITEIIFHPSIESDSLKKITNSWQQRVWESEMFFDPEVLQFFEDEELLFTNWKEMMTRFRERT